jgi:phosphoribosylaminoimidazolecarboxamide formyltransferase/IMP cyclohydrolase
VKVKRALISVSDKDKLLDLGKALEKNGCEILSTGGTAAKMRDAGIKVKDVDDHTGFPEILNGRVKTLHPLIHGGLLGVRGNKEHATQMKKHKISNIDMVVCNLYPFAETVAKGADFSTCIENIDIGGPSMVRSAAKNNAAVAILTDPKQYKEVITQLNANKGALDFKLRKKLACAAYTRTAEYDTAISKWFKKQIK